MKIKLFPWICRYTKTLEFRVAPACAEWRLNFAATHALVFCPSRLADNFHASGITGTRKRAVGSVT